MSARWACIRTRRWMAFTRGRVPWRVRKERRLVRVAEQARVRHGDEFHMGLDVVIHDGFEHLVDGANVRVSGVRQGGRNQQPKTPRWKRRKHRQVPGEEGPKRRRKRRRDQVQKQAGSVRREADRKPISDTLARLRRPSSEAARRTAYTTAGS